MQKLTKYEQVTLFGLGLGGGSLLLNRLENWSSKQFTESKNIENWATYGQNIAFSLNKFY